MDQRFPHTTVQCLAAIAQHHRLPINPERLIEDYALGAEEPPAATLLRMAADIGLKAKQDKLSWRNLLAQQGVFPLIARMKDGTAVIVVGASDKDGGTVVLLNPLADNATEPLEMGQESFCNYWQGDVYLMKRVYALPQDNQPFGFRWFIPEIMKQKAALRDVDGFYEETYAP